MPTIWDRGVYGLVYHGREVDLTSKVDYVTSATRIIIFRKSGGVLGDLDVLRKHGFERLEEWLPAEEATEAVEQRLQELTHQDAIVFLESRRQLRTWQLVLERLGIRFQLLQLVISFLDGMLPRYRQVYEMLEDEASRRAYTNSLSNRFKLLEDKDLADVCSSDQYFCVPEIRRFSADEVFVDCGAYVGDTVESYLNHCGGFFRKIIAFEPSSIQFAAMQKRFRRLREEWALSEDALVAVHAGVGSQSAVAALELGIYSDNLTGIHIVPGTSAGENDIDIVALDEALRGQRVDFIKADIEGYEMDMLRGAEHLIREQHPRLAICLYHKLTDPYDVPLYLKELVPEYHFKVCHHSMRFVELVLYAYCD